MGHLGISGAFWLPMTCAATAHKKPDERTKGGGARGNKKTQAGIGIRVIPGEIRCQDPQSKLNWLGGFPARSRKEGTRQKH